MCNRMCNSKNFVQQDFPLPKTPTRERSTRRHIAACGRVLVGSSRRKNEQNSSRADQGIFAFEERAKARYRCYDFLVGAKDFIQRGSSARGKFLRAQLPPLAITAASLIVSSTFPKNLSAAVPKWVKVRHNIADEILQWCDAGARHADLP
jgi:hypothetical protein